MCSPDKFCVTHGKLKRRCADPQCGGGQDLCKEHRRVKSACKDCGGGSRCKAHNIINNKCYICNPNSKSKCEHKKQKYQCTICKTGTGICECGINKSKCRKHGGVSFCVHDRDKSKCIECNVTDAGTTGTICKHLLTRSRCRECGAGSLGEGGLVSKGWCKTGCGTRLSELRYNGMCAGCDPNKTLLIEDHVKKTIDEWAVANDFGYPSLDGYTFEVCDKVRLQPDRAYRIKDGDRDDVYIIEIDESGHADRASECENTRMSNMATVIFPMCRVVFLRLSTSTYVNNTGMSLRVSLVMDFLKKVATEDPYIHSVVPGVSVGVHYFFYSYAESIHITHAAECDPIQVLGRYYCDSKTLNAIAEPTSELISRDTEVARLESSRNSLIYGLTKKARKS